MSKSKPVIYAFGRFNPPTLGHVAQFDEMIKHGQETKAEVRIIVSNTRDDDKNPLSVEDRIGLLQLRYPTVKISSSNSAFTAAEELVTEGFTHLISVAGSDYVSDKMFERLEGHLCKFADKKISVSLMISGKRNAAVSATLAREAAANGDFTQFIELTTTNSEPTEYMNRIITVYEYLNTLYNPKQSDETNHKDDREVSVPI